MRRVPRLRRPSGLTASTQTPQKITRCASTPFSSSAQSRQIPRPATRSPYPHNINRYYSTEKQPTTTTPPPPPPIEAQETTQQQEEYFADDLALEQEYAGVQVEADGIAVGPYKAPPPRANAARPQDIADPTYAPATSSAGLKMVGGLSHWWDKPEHWDAAGDFASFRPKQKVTDPALIDVAVRRAVIEALALREVGREDDLVEVWSTALSKADTQALLAREVKVSANGAATLGAVEAAAVAEQLRWKDVVETAAEEETLSAEEAGALVETWDKSWRSVSIADPRIRFAITKRVFQLTGHLVPDHQLSALSTVSSLLHTLHKPPKPATLTQEIQERRRDLVDLPNVSVTPRRVTRGDKEIALGRFKIMQKEFAKRGLPAKGHGNAATNKEVDRIMGRM
ncbi:ribosomal subunit 39S-domain-containing protein [Xylariaceae sp. FL0594]|nr:ribosomal subunit 39S-domain-containing protein [Xylariaceae sp. FL0594]